MLHRLRDLVRERDDLAFESTLAGRSALRLLTAMLADGYDVHIFYLWLPTPELAVARVRWRVESGGHDVQASVILRRFWKSLVNFDTLYRPIATTWRVYDGSAPGRWPLIAHGTASTDAVVLDMTRWLEIRRRIEEVA